MLDKTMKRLSLLAACTGLCITAAQAQPANMVPMGNTNLPTGQYMMTNMNTGQSYYVFVSGTGQLMVQDPRALNISVQALNQAAAAPVTPTAGAPANPQNAAGGRGFGSILKQGLDTFLQTQTQPAAGQ
ncbi:MAG: hypothetical protein K2Y32_09770 [Candidatus Obscuribacterales bacterium]|nr:hypothetical protein [Candidatus Obscuribacterales bacterium]